MIKKFGMLMILGALLGGIVLSGCGGDDDTTENAAPAAGDKTPKEPE